MPIDAAAFLAAMRQLQAQTGTAANPDMMAQFFLATQGGGATLDEATSAARNYLTTGTALPATEALPALLAPDANLGSLGDLNLLNPGGGTGAPSAPGGPGPAGISPGLSGSAFGSAIANAMGTNANEASTVNTLSGAGRGLGAANTVAGLFGLGVPGLGQFLSISKLALALLGKNLSTKNAELADLSTLQGFNPQFEGGRVSGGDDPGGPGLSASGQPTGQEGLSVGLSSAGPAGAPPGSEGIGGIATGEGLGEGVAAGATPSAGLGEGQGEGVAAGAGGSGASGGASGDGGVGAGGVGTGAGGVGGDGGVAGWHTGGYVRGRGKEVLAKLQPGEFVIPRGRTAEKLRQKTEGPRPGPSPDAIAALDRALTEARSWLGHATYPTSRV